MVVIMKYVSCQNDTVISVSILCVWGSEEDVACELTTGTVLCGSVSQALRSRRSDSKKTASHQTAAAAEHSQVDRPYTVIYGHPHYHHDHHEEIYNQPSAENRA